VCQPTSWVADRFVRAQPSITVLPARGFAMDRETFDRWAQTQPTLLLGNFYRDARRRFDVLMDGTQPAGSRWNFDEANRKPPPKGSACLKRSGPLASRGRRDR
jgi:deoxyribodipyrimidine photolyase-related protein